MISFELTGIEGVICRGETGVSSRCIRANSLELDDTKGTLPVSIHTGSHPANTRLKQAKVADHLPVSGEK